MEETKLITVLDLENSKSALHTVQRRESGDEQGAGKLPQGHHSPQIHETNVFCCSPAFPLTSIKDI